MENYKGPIEMEKRAPTLFSFVGHNTNRNTITYSNHLEY